MRIAYFLLFLVFTTSVLAQSPGGVGTTNLKLWNKADAGVTLSGSTVTGWADQTGTNTFSVVGSPKLSPSVLNYNPSIIMNGSSRFQGNTSISNMTHVFAVGFIENSIGVESGALIGTLEADKYFFTSYGLPRRFLCKNETATVEARGFSSNTIPYGVFTEDLGKTPASNDRIRVNGNPITNSGSDPAPFSGVPNLGARGSGSYLRNTSALVELIVFNTSLSNTDESKVESYLAIKYGLTLEHDYLNAAGTTVFSVSGDHAQNIIGIGRDDASGLYQKQSHERNDLYRVHLNSAALSNDNNIGTFSDNSSFIMSGDNNAGVYFTSNTERPSDMGVLSRVNREWKITNTEFSDVFSMQIRITSPPTGPTTNPDPARIRVMVDDDGNFANGGTTIHAPVITYSSGIVTVSDITLSMIPTNSTRYLTLVYVAAPGSVSDALTFWLKSNVGITAAGGQVAQWNDNSANALHVAQAATASRPAITASAFNYNPGVTFDGSNDILRNINNPYNLLVNAVSGTNDNTTGSIFSVARFGSGVTSSTIFSQSPEPACGTPVVFSGLSSGALQVGGRSRLSGTISVADPSQPFMATALEAPGSGNAVHYLNGGSEQTVSNTVAEVCPTDNIIQMGSGLNGSVAEVITYHVKVSDAERRKIESYLAIKYGITMNATGGGTFGNYTSTSGLTLWNASDNSSYHNDVIGIGRDDNTGLTQKQSHTAADDLRVYLSSLATTNEGNNGNLSNGSFIMMGHNNDALEFDPSHSEYPSGVSVVSRLGKEWKITNTAFTNTFSVDIKMPSNVPDAANLRMLIDDDGDFSNGGTSIFRPTITFAAGVLTISGITPSMIATNSTRYFTLARTVSPASISNNLTLWLKTDAGVVQNMGSVTQWNDQSSGLHVTASSSARQPVLNRDMINYYPAVFFDGSDGLERAIGSNYDIIADAAAGVNTNTTASIFTVASSRRESGNIFSQYPNPGCGLNPSIF